MKMNGIELISRGIEDVCIYGEWLKRTVYCIKDAWRFFAKINGEFIEVYHRRDYFSTTKNTGK